MSLFPPIQKPSSLLGYHRILSPKAGVRVSPLCLGGANFGDAWSSIVGVCDKQTSFAMLDYFYEQGGNFIDTANNYQAGESETWIGEWLQAKGVRDEIVLATKFTTGSQTPGVNAKIKSNLQGNHAKSLRLSVEASLKKLQTDYIDLLYVHWWDFTTSVEELMNSLHALVQNGKVIYLGISDTPAWLVVKCNDYAKFHGLTPFSVYQGRWSCANRDFERDIIPMCLDQEMAIAPWGSIGGGQLKPAAEYNDPNRDGRKMGPQDAKYARIADKLDIMAKKKGTAITSIALAYVRLKAPYVFPIVGGRKIEHLKGNIEALGLDLTQDEIDEIEDAEPFDPGFPMSFLFDNSKETPFRSRMTASDMYLVRANTALESVPGLKPIVPRTGEKTLKLGE